VSRARPKSRCDPRTVDGKNQISDHTRAEIARPIRREPREWVHRRIMDITQRFADSGLGQALSQARRPARGPGENPQPINY
jgi:hypothetical protein